MRNQGNVNKTIRWKGGWKRNTLTYCSGIPDDGIVNWKNHFGKLYDIIY